jgi:hypothetical protein
MGGLVLTACPTLVELPTDGTRVSVCGNKPVGILCTGNEVLLADHAERPPQIDSHLDGRERLVLLIHRAGTSIEGSVTRGAAMLAEATHASRIIRLPGSSVT